MRIACLQFAPQLGQVIPNLERADDILNQAAPEEIDLLVLPELALCGYNFASLRQIWPHFESTQGGISAAWARQTALQYDCTVVMGYPEKVDGADNKPADPVYHNSALIVNGDGDVVGNHRKAHLFHTDETWALEGQRGFYTVELKKLGKVSFGISMDINPYKFEAAWDDYEFSHHVVDTNTRLVVLTMAWSTDEPRNVFLSQAPKQPDLDTLLYWISRLQPILQIDADDHETTIVLCNRCGLENDATYVGTSTVLGIKRGEVLLHGILGRGEEKLLVADTTLPPEAKLLLRNQDPVLLGTAAARHDDGVFSMALNPSRLPARQRRTWSGSSRRQREYASRGPYRTQGSIVVIPLDRLTGEAHWEETTERGHSNQHEHLQHNHPRNGTPASHFSVSSSEDSDGAGDGDDEEEEEEEMEEEVHPIRQPLFRRRLPFAPTYHLRIPGAKVEPDRFKPPVLAPHYHQQRQSEFSDHQFLTTKTIDYVPFSGYVSEATPIVDSPMSAMSFFADEGVGNREDAKTHGRSTSANTHKHQISLQHPSRRPKAATRLRKPLTIIVPRIVD